DCAQAHGALYKNKIVGGLSDAGCFSFYPGKNLGAFGEGGAVTANDEELIEKINVYKNQGSAVRYYHDVIGYNFRLDGIQGAVLSLKLKYIDEWTKARQKVAQKYFDGIKNDKIKMQEQPEWAKSVFHLFVVEVDDREKFRKYMDENGIGTGIHYPVPCHLQKAYEDLGYKKGDLPFAEYHCEHCVSLPMYPELNDDEIAKVIEICNKYN
ncbi:MAG: DegT/DnrJ/EryC1/StrS family aminotransferase, partial [Clostridia bacterium]|nr:DegT/DnrJ/EryC1/StrS family aminotransferase [Clostridia bacterium]